MSPQEAAEFSKVGAELVEVAESDQAGILAAAKEADIILLGSTPITRELMEAAPKCIAILARTVGYDPIDVKNATAQKEEIAGNRKD